MGCFKDQSDLPASPVSTTSRDSWQQRAIIAVASTILTIGYHMLKEETTYRELGGNYFDKRNPLRTTRRLVKRLEALGHRVILAPTQSPFQSSD